MDIIARAARILDRLVVAVAENPGKEPLFDVAGRVAMIDAELGDLRAAGHDVSVRAFDNLLIHFTQGPGASIIVRGLRAVSDFEYEFQMASMNSRLDPDIETLFLTASERQQFIASGLVKEIARLGGDARRPRPENWSFGSQGRTSRGDTRASVADSKTSATAWVVGRLPTY